MPETKTCARCGAGFGCGAKESRCWCADLPPVMPVKDAGCLCPDCLKKAIEEKIAAQGLCASCRHAKALTTKGESELILCGRSKAEPRYDKYPRLPKTSCPGFETGNPSRDG